MLGYYNMSLAGTSHLNKNIVCQDANEVKRMSNDWIVAVIADGVGSAKYSDKGSSIAVLESVKFIEENICEEWHTESLQSLLLLAFHHALKAIKKQSELDENSIRDYDTTLTCIIYNGVNVVYGHVGDGGIIILNNFGEFSLVTTAQKGEEFNTVIPLRAGPKSWVFGTTSEKVAAIALLTDGIYDIVCPWLIAKKEQPIYINYIRSFMDKNILKVVNEDDFCTVEKEIKDFLESDLSKQITDDKTVVTVINTDVTPEIKDNDYYTEPNWKELLEELNNKLYNRVLPIEESPSDITENKLSTDSDLQSSLEGEENLKDRNIVSGDILLDRKDSNKDKVSKKCLFGFLKNKKGKTNGNRKDKKINK